LSIKGGKMNRKIVQFHLGDDDGKTLYMCARSGLYRMKFNIEGIRP